MLKRGNLWSQKVDCLRLEAATEINYKQAPSDLIGVMEMLRNWTLVRFPQLGKITYLVIKKVHFKWVNYKICTFYLKKALKKEVPKWFITT